MERKEAIEIVRKLYNESLFLKKDKEAMATLIPELAESEDEKVRKELLLGIPKVFPHDKAFRYIAYLEKQGEQKFEQKFFINDKVIHKATGKIWTIHYYLKDTNSYYVEDNDGLLHHYKESELKLVEQKPNMLELCEIEHIEHGKFYYCIKDYYDAGNKIASKGDVIQALRGMSIMGLGVGANEYFIPVYKIIQEPAAWSEEDQSSYNEICSLIYDNYRVEDASSLLTWFDELKERVQPQQEWSEIDKQRIDNIIYFIQGHTNFSDSCKGDAVHFLKSLKERVQPQQEWSEEEEELRLDAIKYLEIFDAQGIHGDKALPAINWLKSLRPQSHWRPSDEQLDSLYDVLNPCDGFNREVLESLYVQLKKLREE